MAELLIGIVVIVIEIVFHILGYFLDLDDKKHFRDLSILQKILFIIILMVMIVPILCGFWLVFS